MVVPIAYYLVLSAILFSIGVAAFLIKRNIITVFMSIELMLNAVNLTFVAFAHHWHQVSGQIFVFFVMVVAAAEAAVGLAIIIAIFRTRNTLNVDQVTLIDESGTLDGGDVLPGFVLPIRDWFERAERPFAGRE